MTRAEYQTRIANLVAADTGGTVAKAMTPAYGVRLSVDDDAGTEVAHGYLYLMFNDLHDAPFGFMEDIFVAESARSMGYGTRLLHDLIAAARELGCYKLVGTSRHERPRVHELYKRL